MVNPAISVILPIYNCEKYIKFAVESILNQTFLDFELLIIDDASTDSTLSIVKKYQDSRIKLIEKRTNSGYTTSLNLGLKLAKGKYIARMDGDDICFNERFEKQFSFLESNQDVIVCGSSSIIIGSDSVVSVPENYELIKLALLRGNCMIHPSVMIRKKTIDDFSITYDSSKEPAEDYDLWVRLAMIGKFHNLQEVLIQYRIHENQVSNIQNENQRNISKQTRFKILNHLPFSKTDNDISILKKFINYDISIKYNEIVFYHEKIKGNILQSNVNGFFEQNGLEDYLNYIEFQTVKSYFLKRKKYNPSIFFNYLKIKSLVTMNLAFKDEFKLLFKSFILYQKV
jgi:glycosyltransferase involved in cell wall biosynthesis